MIGLCLAFECQNNYGTQLQSYATLKVIQDLGYSCEIIIYHKKYKLSDYPKGVIRLFRDNVYKEFWKRAKCRLFEKRDALYEIGYGTRQNAVRAFKEKYLFPCSIVYTGFDALKAGSDKYTTLVTGSDQVWLPSGYASKFYTLMFASENVSRVSYASSFGVSYIPSYHQKEANEFLNRMNYISVREIKGKELVEQYSKKQAKVVVDPTMLISSSVWENMLLPIEETNGYIFCYFLGRRREEREQANILKKHTGLKIIVLKHLDEYIPEDNSFGDESPYDVGPEKFISYIKNASYVLTDSFHGTVFSILFKKQFITFYRNDEKEKMSKNTRIDSLLGQLGMMERLFDSNRGSDILSLADRKIKYNCVHEKLNKLRAESMEFLSNALGACEEK